MQPYIFPYIGYFQLMAQSHIFVSHDDVAFIKGGWINRNRFAHHGRIKWLTLPIHHASHALPINRRHYAIEGDTRRRILRRLEAVYRRAPYFTGTMEIIEDILGHEDHTVSKFNENALTLIAREIGITTPIHVSSEIMKCDELRGQDRVINICHKLSAITYVNPIGGSGLYDCRIFRENGLNLAFLRSGPRSYPVAGLSDCEHLSIIDVMMACSPNEIRTMLSNCSLITAPIGMAE